MITNFFKNTFYILNGYINLFLYSLGLKKSILYKKRYSICKKCEHRKGITCGICGCVLAAKVCTDYPISTIDNKSIGGCPLNPPKW